jgi:hypothetical protein
VLAELPGPTVDGLLAPKEKEFSSIVDEAAALSPATPSISSK